MSDTRSKKPRRSPRSPTRTNKDGGGVQDMALNIERKTPESPIRPDTPATSNLGAVTPMNDLKANLTKVILSDPAILTPIIEAVAEALVTKLLSPDRIDSFVDRLAKSEPLVTSLVKSLESEVKQEVYQSLHMDAEDMGDAITTLEDKYSTFYETHKALQIKLDDLEQYSRRNCLIIHGLDDSNDYREPPESVVVSRLNTAMPNLHICMKDIDRVHRLGKPQQSPHKSRKQRPRPMIVKFVSYQHRAKAFQEKRLLKGTGMGITESLTPARLALLKTAQQNPKVTSAWSLDGRIICLLQNNHKVTVSSMAQLENI